MKLSVSTSVYYRYSLEESIKRIANLGFEGVEIWGGRPHAYAADMTGERIKAVNGLLQENKLFVTGFIPAQFRYPTNLGIADEQIRQDSIEYINKSIDTAVSLGSKFLSICPGFALNDHDINQGYEFFKDSLLQILDYTAKYDELSILVEPGHRMESNICVYLEECARLMEDVDNPQLGLVLDNGHLTVNKESFVDAFKMLGDKIKHIHVDDNHGNSDDHLVPGEGKIDFRKLLADLHYFGYDGYLTIELGFGYTLDPDTAVYRSKYFLEQFELIG